MLSCALNATECHSWPCQSGILHFPFSLSAVYTWQTLTKDLMHAVVLGACASAAQLIGKEDAKVERKDPARWKGILGEEASMKDGVSHSSGGEQQCCLSGPGAA